MSIQSLNDELTDKGLSTNEKIASWVLVIICLIIIIGGFFLLFRLIAGLFT